MSVKAGSSEVDAVTHWGETVRAEHAQADRVRTDDPNADHWKKLAHRFAPEGREKAFQDETLKGVVKYVRVQDTVLDVGAGAGRLALPLAEKCRHVTAVEPSAAMQERLREQAASWGIENLTVVPDRWEDTKVERADVVICAHVIYTVQEIGTFLQKLSSSSTRDVLVVTFEEPAMANYFPLWELVYGEKRISLPALNELKTVLDEMQIRYSTEQLPEWESRPFTDVESAIDESMARLFMSPGALASQYADKLRAVLPSALVPYEGGLRFKWAKPHRPWIVRWSV